MSLTPDQAKSVKGTEFIFLVSHITKTGTLDKNGLPRLWRWLQSNQDLDWDPLQLLRSTIQQSVVDGKVSRVGIGEIWKAIERAMPSNDKEVLKSLRRKHVDKMKAEKKSLKDAERAAKAEQKRIEKEMESLNRSIWSGNFMVAGVEHRWYKKCRCGDTIELRRELDNEHSKNAVAVFAEGRHIGYVPETERRENWSGDPNRRFARELAPLLDKGGRYTAEVVKILDRANPPIPVLDVDVYRSDATVECKRHFPLPLKPLITVWGAIKLIIFLGFILLMVIGMMGKR